MFVELKTWKKMSVFLLWSKKQSCWTLILMLWHPTMPCRQLLLLMQSILSGQTRCDLPPCHKFLAQLHNIGLYVPSPSKWFMEMTLHSRILIFDRMWTLCNSPWRTCRSMLLLITSLTQTKIFCRLMFWSTDDGLYNVDQLTNGAQVLIDTARERNTSKEDMYLLDEAFKHMYVGFWSQHSRIY